MPVTRRQFIKRGAGMVTVGIVITRVWLSDRPRRLSETVEMCWWLAQGGLNSGRAVAMNRSRRDGA